MALTDIQIRNSKPRDKQYKLSDSDGLYLLIKPNNKKYWRLKYRIEGKEKLLSIGAYPITSLSEAREIVLKAKKQIKNNIDPSKIKQEEKKKHIVDISNSFIAIAHEWHNNQKLGWTERHANYVIRRLQADIFPTIGDKQIDKIKAPELLDALRLIENVMHLI